MRSSPVDQRRHKGHAYWEAHDFDGNGTINFMRQASEDGELVELPGHPGVMVPRMPEDPPVLQAPQIGPADPLTIPRL